MLARFEVLQSKAEAAKFVAGCDCALPRKGQVLYVNLGTMRRIETGYTMVEIVRLSAKVFQFTYCHPSPIGQETPIERSAT